MKSTGLWRWSVTASALVALAIALTLGGAMGAAAQDDDDDAAQLPSTGTGSTYLAQDDDDDASRLPSTGTGSTYVAQDDDDDAARLPDTGAGTTIATTPSTAALALVLVLGAIGALGLAVRSAHVTKRG